MEPAWSPHGATNRTGTLRSAAPACPPGGTPHTIAVSCHRRDGQLVYAGKSFFLLFLFPPQHLCRDRSHRGRWLNSRCYLFFMFFNKDLWHPGKRKQQPLDKWGAGGRGEEFVQMFPADGTEMQPCCFAHSCAAGCRAAPAHPAGCVHHATSLLFLEDWSCCPFPERCESIETSLDFSSDPPR